MTTVPKSSPWDFGNALQLLKNSSDLDSNLPHPQNADICKTDAEKPAAALGNFSKLWQTLGIESDYKADAVPVASDLAIDSLATETTATKELIVPNPNRPPGPAPKDDTYASDGGYNPSRKNVTWIDELDILEEATDEPASPTSDEGPGDFSLAECNAPKVSKKEKKAAKKETWLQRKAQKAERKARRVVESEADIRKQKKKKNGTPAWNASIHAKALPQPHLMVTRTQVKVNGPVELQQLSSDNDQPKKTPTKAPAQESRVNSTSWNCE